MLFENSTNVKLELIGGDVRETSAPLIVIGRDPLLVEHYQSRLKARFLPTSNNEFCDPYIFVCGSPNGQARVVSSRRRPTRKRFHAFENFYIYELVRVIAMHASIRHVEHIAMAPISARMPEQTAMLMVRLAWVLSVTSFLKLPGICHCEVNKELRISIYATEDLELFSEVVDSKSYMRPDSGGFDLACNPGKRKRYLRRNGFPFRKLRTSTT